MATPAGMLNNWAMLAVLYTCMVVFTSADVSPVFSISLLGDNKEVNLSKLLSKPGRLPKLCAGQAYTLTGSYTLVGICTNDPPFTATLSVDGNAIYNPTGLADNYTVPIPSIITSTPGMHTFSVVFSGGTYSNSASCADVLNFGIPSNSVQVSVVNCTAVPGYYRASAAIRAAAAPFSAPQPESAPEPADAPTAAEGFDVSPGATADSLQMRLAAHKDYIQKTVQLASEAAAKEALEQFGK